jgi:aryl-alcohol dehydrogenase-like predicted oxidoreductase
MASLRYHTLGNSGLRVSELCLGTMTFGTEWGWGADAATATTLFEHYLAAGGNFIDTANYYTQGSSERILAPLIKPRRDELVVATKFTLNMDRTGLNTGGNHRKNIRQALEASLRRLDTDYIDVYWLHAWDFTTGIEEVMRTLDDLVSAGKVLYIGISDTPAWIVSQANMLAQLRGWVPFQAIQIEYSLIQRTVERELIPMAQALGLSVLAWSPLGAGVLTGKYNAADSTATDGRLKPDSRRLAPRNLELAQAVQAAAAQLGCSPAQVALSWLMGREGKVIPILGARKPEQLLDNLAAAQLTLPEAIRAHLDRLSAVELGFPLDFLMADNIREIIFGEKRLNN